MVSLWVLIILTLLAVNLGHEVSLGLRLGRYAVARLRADALAQAGVNRAIIELDQDRNDYDSLAEPWCRCVSAGTGKTLFLKDEVREGSGETFTVGDRSAKEGARCLVDEERRINVSTASFEVLVALLESAGSQNAKALANYIRVFRGDNDPSLAKVLKDCQVAGCLIKGSRFANVQELMLVNGMTSAVLKSLKNKITTFGNGAININTVPLETLQICLKGMAREISAADHAADVLADKIIKLREKVGVYQASQDIDVPLESGDEANIFDRLKDRIVFRSDHFAIEATGRAQGVQRKITAVYEKKNKKIVFWHEG